MNVRMRAVIPTTRGFWAFFSTLSVMFRRRPSAKTSLASIQGLCFLHMTVKLVNTGWDTHLINHVKETLISRYLYSNFTKNCPTCPDINIGNVTNTPKTEVRDLGVIIDKHLSQIKNVCKSAFYALNNVRKIRKYLDSHSTEQLIHAFISREESLHVLIIVTACFAGLPVAEIAKLQRVQNAAARLMTGSKQTEHITPTLRNLHWLPVKQRIKFKTALLVYKAFNGISPSYIKELIVPYAPARRLRSCNKDPKIKNIQFWWSNVWCCSPKIILTI